MNPSYPSSLRRLVQGLLLALLAFWVVPIQAQSYIYYAQSAVQGDGLNYIGRANLANGSGANNAWLQTESGPRGVAVNANYIYWANSNTQSIGRAPLNIASPTDLNINNYWVPSTSGPYASSLPTDVAVDGTYIYWVDAGNAIICRALLTDPTHPTIPWITLDTGSFPRGIASDGTNVYWTEEWSTSYAGKIGKVPVSHAVGPVSAGLITGLNDPTGIAVNSHYIYWANHNDWSILHANLDGTGSSILLNLYTGPYATGFNPDIFALCVANKVFYGGAEIGTFALTGGAPTRNFVPVVYGPVVGIAVTNDGTVITLTSFTATPKATQVVVAWQTGSEVDTAGFNIWRSASATGTFTKVNATVIPAQGTGVGGASYTWTDTNVSAGQTWYYKLEDIDSSGVSTLHGPVSATVGATSAILSFQATPTDIFLGGGSFLNWTVNGSPALAIAGLGPVSASNLWVTPQSTTPYTLTDGLGDQNLATVTVKPFGLLDMPGLSKAWGSSKGDANYDPSYDLNGDGKVDDADVALCLKGL